MQSDSGRTALVSFLFSCALGAPLILSGMLLYFGIPSVESPLSVFCIGLALICAAFIFFFSRQTLHVPLHIAAWAAVPLAGIALLRTLPGGLGIQEVWGTATAVSTVGAIWLMAACLLAGSFAKRRILQASIAIWTSCASIYVLLALVSGFLHPMPWTSVALIASAALVATWGVSASGLHARVLLGASRILLFGTCAVLFNLPIVACLMLSLAIIALALRRSGRSPVLPAGMMFLLIAMMLFGVRGPIVPTASDIRPSLTFVGMVMGPTFAENPLTAVIGTGPETFGAYAEEHRPKSLNMTPLSTISFTSAHSGAITLFFELGMVGVFSFLLIVGVLAFSAYRAVALNSVPLASAAASGLFAFAAFVVYTPDTPLLLFSAFITGACLAAGASFRSVHIRIPFALVLSAVSICTGLYCAYVGGAQVIAHAFYTRASAFQSAGNGLDAVSLGRAASIWPAPEYQRAASRALFESSYEALDPQYPEQFLSAVDVSIELVEKAVQADRKDWRSWLSRGSLYLSLLGGPAATTTTQALAQQVEDSIQQARALAPTRPDVPYLAALLYSRTGDTARARRELAEALALKADYAPALKLLESLQ